MKFATLLFLPLYALAAGEETAVKDFLKLQGELQKTGAAPCATCAVSAPADLPVDIACVLKLCKPKERGEYAMVLVAKKAVEAGELLYRKEFPEFLVKDIAKYQAALSGAENSSSEIEQAALKGQVAPLSAIARALLNMQYAFIFADQVEIANHNGVLIFEEVKTRGKLETVIQNPKQLERVLAAFRQLYNSEFLQLSALSNGIPADIALQNIFGDASHAAEAVHLEGELLAKSVASKDPGMGRIYLEKDDTIRDGNLVYERWRKGKGAVELSLKDQAAILNHHVMNRTLQLVVGEERSPFLGELFYDPIALERSIGSRVEVQQKMANWNQKTHKKELEKIDDCYTAFLLQSLLLPEKAEVAKLGDRIKKAKALAKEGLRKNFSAETSQKMGEAIDRLKMFMPPAKDQIQERFQDAFHEKIREQENQGIDWNSLSPENKTAFAYLVFQSSLIDLTGGKKDGDPDVDGVCKDLAYNPYPDATYIGAGIQVGPMMALTDEESAVSTLLHEMGHFISSEFRAGKSSAHSFESFKKVRQCLGGLHPAVVAKQQPEVFSVLKEPYMVSASTEEDFADFLSGTFQGPTKINPFCDLMPVKDGGIGFDNAPSIPLENDPNFHSGDLFRLVHHEWLRGAELPAECLSELKKTHPALGAKNWCKL